MRYLIVGVDPGIKTGYAALDLDGNLVSSGCEKEASDERIVKALSSVGVPVLIAADTNPPSHFVQKVAARLNVKVSYPSQSMTRLEKRQIGAQIEDVHIRDAYAAAIKAYRKYANRLRQIESMPVDNKDELKRMVVTGQRIAEHL
ncbi:MAG: DUF460 domain-containing protein [Candidatus Micrarchaeota archaeon]